MMMARAIASICCSPPDRRPACAREQRAKRGEQVERPVVGLSTFAPSESSDDLEVLHHGEPEEERPVLDDVRDTASRDAERMPRIGRLAHDLDRRPRCREQPGDRAQRRRLAGSVRPEQGQDLAGGHVEVQTPDDGNTLVAGVEPAQLEAPSRRFRWCEGPLHATEGS